jgi:mRNA interferase RelE/StbE
MTYRIEFRPAAMRELAKLETSTRRRIAATLDPLATTPRPPGVEKLKGRDHRYRVRCGDYRIIYEIDDRVLIILVLRIGHRRQVYR